MLKSEIGYKKDPLSIPSLGKSGSFEVKEFAPGSPSTLLGSKTGLLYGEKSFLLYGH